ncbi:MAG: hypothetical protein HY954_02310 [Deltaproteobacteria bacterium]|nr:hypothetical protein [Deltaproteobacteria bacterium]
MSQTIRKEIARFCRCLLYMTAVYFCPAVRKRVRSGEGDVNLFKDVQAESLQVNRAGEEAHSSPLAIFGKVIESLPINVERMHAGCGTDAFDFEFQDHILEYDVKPRTDKPVHAYHNSKEWQQKTGLDLIRLTLNLARGNLEGASCACL